MTKHLFLYGGNPSIEKPGRLFAKLAGKEEGRVALLIERRDGWESYLPRYTVPWEKEGLTSVDVVMDEKDGTLDVEAAVKTIREATGIFIGGGNTEHYHALYTRPEIKEAILAKVKSGAPFGGNSAGALIAPETCLISPSDSDDREPKKLEGLGLLTSLAVSVHYTEWNEEKAFRKAMKHAGLKDGIGIDENACVHLKNGRIEEKFGEHVHTVSRSDLLKF
ncbi:Type 1 glutamine amidotransferase-like domain-containing protein [Alteribacter natronophilus]|uniref:Type 1 glutamine amidotransferase-like domain-containing protein n=1 Tax=Alteribacter natronophilus TaxID=2583810 RepID=UPI00110EEA17|nr:Type 1 glutamine amidotransferase-like domain-containing protein [Alteribacter natronophilus]TMW70295.1 peptidase S51 [Alteribacter natronophilus]